MFALLLCGAIRAEAHAVVRDSTPAVNATITETNPAIRVHFNSRIDLHYSTLTLTGPDDQPVKLSIDPASTVDTLISHTKSLPPGAYKLRWQVLSIDGHITRGDIPFTVAPATAAPAPIATP
jgi:methionine-rich copper-binding protein CopC